MNIPLGSVADHMLSLSFRLLELCAAHPSTPARPHHFKPGDMFPGGSGTGRTTFVNTLVEHPLLTHRTQALLQDPSNPHSPLDPEVVQQAAAQANQETPIRIKPVNVELEEDGVRIALTIVDTPGFGEGIDNEYW